MHPCISPVLLAKTKKTAYFYVLYSTTKQPTMSTTQEQELREEPDEVLFANMKHNSQCSFEKKIISGRILCERQEFDRLKMANEKKILVDSIKAQLETYNDPIKSARRLNRKALSPALWSMTFTTIFAITEWLDCRKFSKDFDWIGLSIFLFFVVAILAYEFATLNLHIRKKYQTEQDNKELLTNRLTRVEKEWQF